MFIFERERETETEYEHGEGQRERERDPEEAGFRLQAVSTEPDVGLKPMNRKIRSWTLN